MLLNFLISLTLLIYTKCECPGKKRIIIGSGAAGAGVRTWDVFEEAKCGINFDKHTVFITNVAFSNDGLSLFTADRNGVIHAWDMIKGIYQTQIGSHKSSVEALKLSLDGKFLISGSLDKTIKIWNLSNSYSAESFEFARGIRRIAITSDQEMIIGFEQGPLILFDYKCGITILDQLNNDLVGNVSSLAVSSNGILAVAFYDKNIIYLYLVDILTTQGYSLLKKLEKHTGVVNDLAFFKTELASCSNDTTALIWDIDSGKVKVTLSGHNGPVNCLDYSPDGKFIVTGSSDSLVKTWNVDTGENIHSLFSHTTPVNSIKLTSIPLSLLTEADENCYLDILQNNYSFALALAENYSLLKSCHLLDSNCYDCSFDDKKCYLCNKNYYYNGTKCIQCNSVATSSQNQCSKCSQACENCGSGGICNGCLRGYHLGTSSEGCIKNPHFCAKYSSNPSKCDECLSGYFLNGGTCAVCCFLNCLDCSETVCNKCDSGYSRYFDKNGFKECVQCKGPDFYLDSATSSDDGKQNCLKKSDCPIENCLECKNHYKDCAICQENYFLAGSLCILCQDDGKYIKGEFCLDCPVSCTKCTEKNSCSECKSNFYLENGICNSCYIFGDCSECDHKKCSKCSCLFYKLQLNNYEAGCVECNGNKEYVDMENNSTDGSGFCLKHENCKIENCNRCSNKYQNCTECNEGYYFYSQKGNDLKCVKCEGGKYIQDKWCKDCIPNCLSCNSTNVCKKCLPNYYITQDGNCNKCPDNCLSCSVGDSCLACNLNFFKLLSLESNNQICSTCKEDGHYIDILNSGTNGTGVCLAKKYCQISNCQKCQKGYSECEVCDSGYFLNASAKNQTCTDCKQKGYFQEGKFCFACHKSCDTCSGPTELNCISCPSDLLLTSAKSCLITCKSAEFYRLLNKNEGECSPCHPKCKTCFGESEEECSSCGNENNKFIFLRGTTCVDPCLKNPSICSNTSNEDLKVTMNLEETLEDQEGSKFFRIIFSKDLTFSENLNLTNFFNISVENFSNKSYTYSVEGHENDKSTMLLNISFLQGVSQPAISIELKNESINYLKDENNIGINIDTFKSQNNLTLNTIIPPKTVETGSNSTKSPYGIITISMASLIVFGNIFSYFFDTGRVSTIWFYFDSLQAISLFSFIEAMHPLEFKEFSSNLFFSHADIISFLGKTVIPSENKILIHGKVINQTRYQNNFYQYLGTASFEANGLQAVFFLLILLLIYVIAKLTVIYYQRKGSYDDKVCIMLDLYKDILLYFLLRGVYFFYSLLTLTSLLQMRYIKNPAGPGAPLAIITFLAILGFTFFCYKYLVNKEDVYTSEEKVKEYDSLFNEISQEDFFQRNHYIFIMLRKLVVSFVLVFASNSPLGVAVCILLLYIGSIIKNIFKNPFLKPYIRNINLATEILMCLLLILQIMLIKNHEAMRSSKIFDEEQLQKQKNMTQMYSIITILICGIYFGISLVLIAYYGCKNLSCLLSLFSGETWLINNDQNEVEDGENEESGQEEEKKVKAKAPDSERAGIIEFNKIDAI